MNNQCTVVLIKKQVVNACQVADDVNDECSDVCLEINSGENTEACINSQVGNEVMLCENEIDHRIPAYFIILLSNIWICLVALK